MVGVWESINELSQGCVDLLFQFCLFTFFRRIFFAIHRFNKLWNCDANNKLGFSLAWSLDTISDTFFCAINVCCTRVLFFCFLHRQLLFLDNFLCFYLCKVQSFSRVENSTRKIIKSCNMCPLHAGQLSTAFKEPTQCDLCWDVDRRMWHMLAIFTLSCFVLVLFTSFLTACRRHDTERTSGERRKSISLVLFLTS